MAEKLVDFAAAGRVARHVELKGVRVIDISAKCDPKIAGPFEPTLDFDCAVVGRESNSLEIGCRYRFTAHAAQAQVAEAVVSYLLTYQIQGSEPMTEEDLAEFAIANGTLHSWPFVRELLHGLTSKMGYVPYTLPVFHFKPKPRVKKESGEKVASTPEPASQPTG